MHSAFFEAMPKQICKSDSSQKSVLCLLKAEWICPDPYDGIKKWEPADWEILHQRMQDENFYAPFLVYDIGTRQKPRFQLISDEERLRVFLYAKMEVVPCEVVERKQHPSLLTNFLPRNFFEEIDILFEMCSKNEISTEELAAYFKISQETLRRRLSLHEFDATERKLILKAGISPEYACRLFYLSPQAKCDVYRAILNGIQGHMAEDLIADFFDTESHIKPHIKHTGFFYNSIDKSIAIMNRSGVPIKCTKEEKKHFTRLIITVPNQSDE